MYNRVKTDAEIAAMRTGGRMLAQVLNTLVDTVDVGMTTKEIANRLKELCLQGQFEDAQNELFSEDAISIEPFAAQGFQKETKGLPAIRAKAELWNSMVEAYHGSEISEPIIAEGSFAISMSMDVTMKERGRTTMTEICLYKIKDGKIISEEFVM